MCLKPFGQSRQLSLCMVVTDGPAGGFPHVLLRIEVGCRCGHDHDLQTRMRGLDVPNLCTSVPWGAVPQQQNWHVGVGRQNLAQVRCRRFGIHRWRGCHEFASCFEVEGAIEVRLGAARITPHGERLPAWSPDRHRGRLEIERGFIHRQDHGLRRGLGRIDQFFSICASKAVTAASLRERNTLAGR